MRHERAQEGRSHAFFGLLEQEWDLDRMLTFDVERQMSGRFIRADGCRNNPTPPAAGGGAHVSPPPARPRKRPRRARAPPRPVRRRRCPAPRRRTKASSEPAPPLPERPSQEPTAFRAETPPASG